MMERHDLHSLLDLGNLFILHQRERAVITCLRRGGVTTANVSSLRFLEVGCGTGGLLPLLTYYGASPDRMFGIDLDRSRIREARRRYPAIHFVVADAARLPLPTEGYDVAIQSTLFTSILDQRARRQAAAEMLRVLRPSGFVLWFDFRYNSPRNEKVRGITRRQITRDLFPDTATFFVSTVLLPPLARRIARASWLVAECLSLLRPLRSHYCALIRPRPTKPAAE
ncbi:MAG: class I SAM-dependent methyltransferase [Chloroflexi bacterium]|nr:MAG: class I SAM-dependent methyltransferase [Chloroflexota bacterium]